MQAPHLPLAAAAAAGHLPAIPLTPHPGTGLAGGGPAAALMGRLPGSAHLHSVKEEKGTSIVHWEKIGYSSVRI